MNNQEDLSQTVPENWPEPQPEIPESWSKHRPVPPRVRKPLNPWVMRGSGIFIALVAAHVIGNWISIRFDKPRWHYTFNDISVTGSDRTFWESFKKDSDESSLNRDGGEVVAVLPLPPDKTSSTLGEVKYRIILKHRGTGHVMSMEEWERRSHDAMTADRDYERRKSGR